ncbi:hypothetical protein HF995_13400 [Sanguibacter hominis ATCC BAA-789]|uniref:Uncharacterized protein n=1 Tax=Sanguibacter hominis ATCC BAA-789 TaxID=1312740 RepID=A0A9X5FFT5_9MICO|nr:hypothetical protein [Sanguibacter hominis]NKX94252.1 hypothetical protein [Sanguibacter hominis ATCC BAA-789]
MTAQSEDVTVSEVDPDTRPAREVAYDADEFAVAVQTWRPLVRRQLAKWGEAGRVEDVMAMFASDLWTSLGRWEVANGSPPLVQWAHGVAKNTVSTYLRTERPGRGPAGRQTVPLEVLVELPGRESEKAEKAEETRAAREIIRQCETYYASIPGGLAKWKMILDQADHERRGVNARQHALELLETFTDSLDED